MNKTITIKNEYDVFLSLEPNRNKNGVHFNLEIILKSKDGQIFDRAVLNVQTKKVIWEFEKESTKGSVSLYSYSVQGLYLNYIKVFDLKDIVKKLIELEEAVKEEGLEFYKF